MPGVGGAAQEAGDEFELGLAVTGANLIESGVHSRAMAQQFSGAVSQSAQVDRAAGNAWAIANGLMTLQYQVLLIPLPLWIISHTHAPRWSVALCALTNTRICVFFHGWVGAGVTTIRQVPRRSATRAASSWSAARCSG